MVNLSETEFSRRISIGLNSWLSLEERKQFIESGVDLISLENEVNGFKVFKKEAYEILRWLEKDSLNSIIGYGNIEFPSFEGLSKRLPYYLLCKGVVPSKAISCVGIVGTRVPNYDALHRAFALGLEAAVSGYSVVSGFAEGIDQAGMRGCVSAHGVCLGVLACGHDVEYPSLTGKLREAIIDSGGCVISMFAPSCPSYKSNFVSRNMVIAAYSKALVLVQAPEKSGTLITGDYVLSMGKDIYVAKEGVGNGYKKTGSTQLARDGAVVISSLAECNSHELMPILPIKIIKSTSLSLSSDLNSKNSKIDINNSFRFGDRLYFVEPCIL